MNTTSTKWLGPYLGTSMCIYLGTFACSAGQTVQSNLSLSPDGNWIAHIATSTEWFPPIPGGSKVGQSSELVWSRFDSPSAIRRRALNSVNKDYVLVSLASSSSLQVSPDSSHVFVDSVTKSHCLNLASGSLVKVTEDGEALAASEWCGNKTLVVAIDGQYSKGKHTPQPLEIRQVILSTPVATQRIHTKQDLAKASVSISPKGSHVLLTCGKGAIWRLVDVTCGRVAMIRRVECDAGFASWRSDGAKVFCLGLDVKARRLDAFILNTHTAQVESLNGDVNAQINGQFWDSMPCDDLRVLGHTNSPVTARVWIDHDRAIMLCTGMLVYHSPLRVASITKAHVAGIPAEETLSAWLRPLAMPSHMLAMTLVSRPNSTQHNYYAVNMSLKEADPMPHIQGFPEQFDSNASVSATVSADGTRAVRWNYQTRSAEAVRLNVKAIK